jgi:hypothetical protein
LYIVVGRVELCRSLGREQKARVEKDSRKELIYLEMNIIDNNNNW